MKLLKELYLLHSPSHNEKEMSKFVQKKLREIGVNDFIVDDDRIYKFKENTVLLSAHMDQVGKKPITEVNYFNGTLFGNGNLGADDKNGIWIILRILEKVKDISFIFSVQEECGGHIKDILVKEKDVLSTMKYGLIFDRKNSGDIIGVNNEYCTKEFQNELCKIGKDFGFKPSTGSWSDANAISSYMSCVNLSVGYYNPHMETEYTKWKELLNSLSYGFAIIENIKDKFDKPLVKTYNGGNYYCKGNYYNKNNYHNKGVIYYEEDDEDWWADWREKYGGDTIFSYKDYDDTYENPIYYCPNCNIEFLYDKLVNINECPNCGSKVILSHYGDLEDVTKYSDEYTGVVDQYYCNVCCRYRDKDKFSPDDTEVCIACKVYESYGDYMYCPSCNLFHYSVNGTNECPKCKSVMITPSDYEDEENKIRVF